MAEHKNVQEALLAAQRVIVPPTKSANNPHFKSKYAPLDAIVEAVRIPLLEAGVTLTWQHEVSDGRDYCTTVLTHAASGTETRTPVPVLVTAPGPQPWKSAVTYAKRIGLESAVGVAPEDDDDSNAAQSSRPPKAASAQPTMPAHVVLMAAAWKRAIAGGKTSNQLIDLLGTFGATNLREVPVDQADDVIRALNEAAK